MSKMTGRTSRVLCGLLFVMLMTLSVRCAIPPMPMLSEVIVGRDDVKIILKPYILPVANQELKFFIRCLDIDLETPDPITVKQFRVLQDGNILTLEGLSRGHTYACSVNAATFDQANPSTMLQLSPLALLPQFEFGLETHLHIDATKDDPMELPSRHTRTEELVMESESLADLANNGIQIANKINPKHDAKITDAAKTTPAMFTKKDNHSNRPNPLTHVPSKHKEMIQILEKNVETAIAEKTKYEADKKTALSTIKDNKGKLGKALNTFGENADIHEFDIISAASSVRELTGYLENYAASSTNITDTADYIKHIEDAVNRLKMAHTDETNRKTGTPPKPVDVVLVPLSKTVLRLSWSNPPDSFEGANKINYYLANCYKGADATGSAIDTKIIDFSPKEERYVVNFSDLAEDTKYTCTIVAVTDNHSSGFVVETISTEEPVVPRVYEVTVNKDSIEIDITPPATANEDIVAVQTACKPTNPKDSKDFGQIVAGRPLADSITVNKLLPDTEYQCKVSAISLFKDAYTTHFFTRTINPVTPVDPPPIPASSGLSSGRGATLGVICATIATLLLSM